MEESKIFSVIDDKRVMSDALSSIPKRGFYWYIEKKIVSQGSVEKYGT
ncbi:hypothetical protein P9847_08390 [Paenibacillus chibensis]|uniref:Uncharacterized protein n=1 Tax=Paenibacillus chibensis TaxID=59846 RepID=A0ABU6PR19_9BACL|nr:hypothetical protein [Paenibacillus chibensis]